MKFFNPKNLQKFFRRENGNASIEFTLWMPFIFGSFIAVSEVAMVYYSQSQLLQVAQDATRQASIGRLLTTEEVSTYVDARLAAITTNAQVQNQVDRGVIKTAITVPIDDLAPFGFFTSLIATDVTVVAQQVAEF